MNLCTQAQQNTWIWCRWWMKEGKLITQRNQRRTTKFSGKKKTFKTPCNVKHQKIIYLFHCQILYPDFYLCYLMLKSLYDWLKCSLRMLDPFVFERYLRLKIITQSICYSYKKKESKVKSLLMISNRQTLK